jgi:hypothetical protein
MPILVAEDVIREPLGVRLANDPIVIERFTRIGHREDLGDPGKGNSNEVVVTVALLGALGDVVVGGVVAGEVVGNVDLGHFGVSSLG